VEKSLSPESAALHLAIGLFVGEEATLGQAAQIAGLPQAAFLRELGKRRIPIHYGPTNSPKICARWMNSAVNDRRL
jgi:predicted HTH domain antitoxin